MSEKSPAFQFYPQDYLSSARVAEMTLEEEGAYIRLLCYCWTTGSIPADPERCARLVGKGCSTDVAISVQRSFNVCSTDVQRMTHDRIEKEREKQVLRRAQTSEAGKKSALARSVKATHATTKNKRSTNVQRNLNPSSSSSDEDECVIELKSQVDQFEQFWSTCPRKTAKGAARKAWLKAIKTATPAQIIEGMKVYAKQVTGTEQQFIAHPATWLNGERWLDDTSAPVKKPRLPDYNTPEGMAELKRLFAEGLHTP